MPNTKYLIFFVSLSFVVHGTVIAHTSIDKKIATITKLIEQSPDNAQFYLTRGELYRIHKEWSKAIMDFNRAAKLEMGFPEVDFYMGRVFLESDQPKKAEKALKNFIGCVPDHSRARILRARALLKLGRGKEASEEYTHAIELHSKPGPELYLERAKILAEEGDANVDEALEGLDAGLQKLGQLVSIQLFAIDLEIKKKRFNDALCRLEQIAEQSQRKETYLVLRGEILEKAGRIDEGFEAYTEALSAIQNLPTNLQKRQVIIQLKARVIDAIYRLKTYFKLNKEAPNDM